MQEPERGPPRLSRRIRNLAAETQVITHIRPRPGVLDTDWRELWEHRELLFVLAGREIRVRYKQAVLGAAWAVLQPLGTMAVFSLVFGRLARMPSDGAPYWLFALAALVPWSYFSNAVAAASTSLIENRALLTRVYFPRLLLPLAPLVAGLVDLGIAVTLLVGLRVILGAGLPGAAFLALPLFAALAVLTAAAAGIWLSVLNAYYRDFRYVVPFLLQLWLYATPVAYPASLVPESWRWLLGLNPMAGVVEGFRWAVLARGGPPPALVLVSAAMVGVLLALGLAFFRRLERSLEETV